MADKINVEGFSVSTANVCTASGGFMGDLIGDTTGLNFSGYNLYAADGAISLEAGTAELSGLSATVQMTLAPGLSGQHMSIVCSDSTQTCDVDADFGGSIATITFTVGQAVSLVSVNSVWYVTGNNGATLS
jgi:hypothetical protein